MLLSAMLAAWSWSAAASEPQRPLRVLFVGNSYLYTNNLPGAVQALAAARGVTIEATMRAEPDYSLSDHLRNRRLAPLLEEPWDWIVLQQGPSALPESRRDLVDSARRIAAQLQDKPMRIALMSAWPAQRNASMSLQAEASYREAATAIEACVLPVAGAWRIARAQANPPPLYEDDRLHSTSLGTLLSAMTVTRGLLGMEPEQRFDAPDGADEVDLAGFRLLDEAAGAAQAQETARCLTTGEVSGA